MRPSMILGFLSAATLVFQPAFSAVAKEPEVVSDIAYKSGENLTDYEKERCRLGPRKTVTSCPRSQPSEIRT